MMIRLAVMRYLWSFLFVAVYMIGNLHVCESKCHGVPKCQVCNETVLICRDGYFQDLDNIVDNVNVLKLQHAEITGNNFTQLNTNLFGSCYLHPVKQLKSLTYLDLSNNSIKTIHGKTFHCIPNLEYLNLGDNQWYLDNHTGIFSSLPFLKTLNLTKAFTDLGINNKKHLTKLSWMFNRKGELENLQNLYLPRNGFYTLPEEAQQSLCSLPALTLLDLSHNNLIEIELPLHPENESTVCLENIKSLKLNRNYLPGLSKPFRSRLEAFKHLESVTLKNNRFDCDCRLKEFYSWLNSTSVKIKHRNELLCYAGYKIAYVNRSILNLTLSDLQCAEDSRASGQIVVGVLLGVLACILIVVVYWKRQRIRKWVKEIPRVSYLSPGRESQFAYSSVDQTTTA